LRLIHLEIELDFAQEFKSLSISQQLHKALTGKKSSDEEQVEPRVEFSSPKKRQLVEWDVNSCRVVIESVTSLDECFGKMVALLETINNVAPIGKLCRREFITYWILPTESFNFKLLEQKYRAIFTTQQPVWKNVFDSSVIIDMKINELIFHHQSGAMGTRQLRQEFMEFNLERIPKVFLFLLATVTSHEAVAYSGQDTTHFLINSFQHCKNHSELFEKIWRENL
jgi:hypothetical protein